MKRKAQKNLKIIQFCEEVMKKQKEIQEEATENFPKSESPPSSPENIKTDDDDDSFFGRYSIFLLFILA